MTTVVCMVCNKTLSKTKDGYDIISHGYCSKHLAEANKEYEAWEKEERKRQAAERGRGCT